LRSKYFKFRLLIFSNKINIGDEKEIYFVRKRPYMDWFLERMSKIFNLAIFTAAVKEYAD